MHMRGASTIWVYRQWIGCISGRSVGRPTASGSIGVLGQEEGGYLVSSGNMIHVDIHPNSFRTVVDMALDKNCNIESCNGWL
jgi:hypothetical protein